MAPLRCCRCLRHYIVDAVRSPIGRRNGALSSTRGDELAAQVLNGLVERNWRRSRRGRGRPARLRHADRRAGLEHRPDGADGRRLARDRLRDDGRPPVRLLDADELQRRRRDLVGPAGRGHLGGRRDDVAGPDGVERRRPLGQAARALGDRPAGDLGRGDRRRVGPLARGAGRVLARVAPARDRGDRRGALRAGDRPGRGEQPARRRPRRGGRDAAARHLRREARRAGSCVSSRTERSRPATRARSATALPAC